MVFITNLINNIKVINKIKKLKEERAQLEHYDGVEKSEDPKIYERYQQIEKELSYLVNDIK